MKRSPAYHLSLGIFVILAAFLAGTISHHHRREARLVGCEPNRVLLVNRKPAREYGLIVRYKAGSARNAIDALRAKLHVSRVLNFDAVDPQLDFEQLPYDTNLNDAYNSYKADPDVDDVEINGTYTYTDRD